MEKPIGKLRNLSNYNEPCEILEILINPHFSMEWEWSKGECPHCKKKIAEKKMHVFKKVEVLLPQSKKNETDMQKRFYIIGYGYDTEGKILFIPNKDMQRLLPQTEKFKCLGGI